ncbi:gamma-glutamyltransferase family protein [Sphingomonas sp. S1-29]|uniref:gamma-glutamyltransferase n=1 Tax=Sphingomonas sp. S1-29 TaxID=2991074 RepID=UPI00223EFDC7|nr:gamma-glutamyltransferase [Sphingomonas sp. S1-29]UZK69683.1 gamma-glutamyltransferase family protein [Sphingomonas sp. S1-29]
MMAYAKRHLALTVTLALVTPGFAAPQSADPERLAIEAREAAVFPTATRTIGGGKGVVSGSASPIAVEAGANVLREGGTAADAAVTTAFAQVTAMLGANVSFAGVAQLVYYEARNGRVYAMDAGWGSWRGETSRATIPDADLSLVTGMAPPANASGALGRKMLVPGFMGGMEAMHRRFGKLRFARLLAPSIWYAENGVPVTPLLAGYFSIATAPLRKTESGRAFALPGGASPIVGSRFVQPELAALLKSLAKDGARYMYSGAWAQRYVETVRGAGGAATLAEMRAYAPSWGEPLLYSSAGATLAGPAATNTSGCAVLEALNLIDHSGSAREGGEAFRTTALALRTAIYGHHGPAAAAFEKRVGVGGTCAARVTPEYGAAAALAMEEMLGADVPTDPGHHSASVVAVDRWGNVAALVHSSNTAVWGDSGLVLGGVPLPVPASIYRHLLTAIAPGARLPSDMTPMILLERGKPVAAVAAIGSSVVPETLRLVSGLRRADADLPALAAAPPLLLNYEQLGVPLLARDELVPAGRYPVDMLEALRKRGLPIREVDAQRVLYVRGTAAFVALRGSTASAEVPGVLVFAAAE